MASDGVAPLAFMSTADDREPMYRYLGAFLRPGDRLLDVGCGDGDFVAFAAAKGVDAFGIDANADNVARARARGLAVHCADAFGATAELGTFDVVSMIHLVEHFDTERADTLVRQASSALAPGGRLVLMTPNFADWTVASHIFWLDPTHVRPYPGPLLASLARAAGLRVIHSSSQQLVKAGLRQLMARPIGRLRFGREFERMNLIVVAQKPELMPRDSADTVRA